MFPKSKTQPPIHIAQLFYLPEGYELQKPDDTTSPAMKVWAKILAQAEHNDVEEIFNGQIVGKEDRTLPNMDDVKQEWAWFIPTSPTAQADLTKPVQINGWISWGLREWRRLVPASYLKAMVEEQTEPFMKRRDRADLRDDLKTVLMAKAVPTLVESYCFLSPDLSRIVIVGDRRAFGVWQSRLQEVIRNLDVENTRQCSIRTLTIRDQIARRVVNGSKPHVDEFLRWVVEHFREASHLSTSEKHRADGWLVAPLEMLGKSVSVKSSIETMDIYDSVTERTSDPQITRATIQISPWQDGQPSNMNYIVKLGEDRLIEGLTIKSPVTYSKFDILDGFACYGDRIASIWEVVVWIDCLIMQFLRDHKPYQAALFEVVEDGTPAITWSGIQTEEHDATSDQDPHRAAGARFFDKIGKGKVISGGFRGASVRIEVSPDQASLFDEKKES